MDNFFHSITANWKEISVIGIIVLKWIYNAWTEGVTFPQFIRQLIGEIVQEAPTSFKLSSDQVKLLAAHSEGKVKIIDMPINKVDTEPSKG